MFFCDFEPSPVSFSIGNETGVALQTEPDYTDLLTSIDNNIYSLNVLCFSLLLVISFKALVSLFKLFIKSL